MSFASRVKKHKPVSPPPMDETQLSALSRHLLRAQEEERKRMSRELHDGTGQSLMVLRLYLGMLAGDAQNPESQFKVQEALKLLDRTIEDLRRIIGRLSPRILEELGLVAAIRREVAELTKNTGMHCHLVLPGELKPLNHEVEVAIYRSLQEALHNIAKHSRARSFTVRLEMNATAISLRVEDDGVGFVPRRPREGFGLTGMKERATVLGGTMQVRSSKGHGTKIGVILPIQSDLPTDAAGQRSPLALARHSHAHSSWPAET